MSRSFIFILSNLGEALDSKGTNYFYSISFYLTNRAKATGMGLMHKSVYDRSIAARREKCDAAISAREVPKKTGFRKFFTG